MHFHRKVRVSKDINVKLDWNCTSDYPGKGKPEALSS
jgi:hypothetical protein